MANKFYCELKRNVNNKMMVIDEDGRVLKEAHPMIQMSAGSDTAFITIPNPNDSDKILPPCKRQCFDCCADAAIKGLDANVNNPRR